MKLTKMTKIQKNTKVRASIQEIKLFYKAFWRKITEKVKKF